MTAEREKGPDGSRLARARSSDTVKAAGVASAQLVANVLALFTTIALARALGTSDYGELARMVSVVTILIVPATALQVAAARDTTLGRLGRGGQATASLNHWILRILALTLVTFLACALLREQMASLLQVSQPWAAALVFPAGVFWISLALQRGVLLGAGGYRSVGISLIAEQGFRLLFGLAAALAGAGVGVIFFCSVPLATVPAILLTGYLARRRLGRSDHEPSRSRLRELAMRNPVPMAGLTLFAILQNADVIAVGHYFSSELSGAYAQAAVAAKGIIWIAVGLGLYLLPEAARLAARGGDARSLLGKTSGLLALIALPVLAAFFLVPGTILDLVFGDKAALAESALPWLAMAMTFLAAGYLAIQFLLALGRRAFLGALAVAAVAVPVVVALRDTSLESVALGLLLLDAVLAGTLFASALLSRPDRGRAIGTDEAEALAVAEASATAEAAIP
ncbi:MAG: oligosaccharide flippase family protein [Solirubrobacterales bacterium]